MLFRAAALTVGQIADPVFRGVVIKSVLFTLCLFTGLTVVFYMARPDVTYFEWEWLNDIAEAVEARHYPGEAPGQSAEFAKTFAVSTRFIAVTLVANILALPFYVIALFIPPLFACIFFGLNGYLLSREYFELVSLRHQDGKAARQLRKANGFKVFLAGVVIAFLITVPIVNLFVPILATVFMLHIFKALQGSKSVEIVS